MDERSGQDSDVTSERTIVNTVSGDVGPGAVVFQAGTVSFSEASEDGEDEVKAAEIHNIVNGHVTGTVVQSDSVTGELEL